MKLKLLPASLFFFLFFYSLKAQMPGSLDLSFGDNGIRLMPLGTANAFGRSLTIQPDGKLVLACIANNGLNTDFALVRLTPDGIQDTSFGTNGIVITDFAIRSDIAQDIAIDGLDRIVVAGYTENGNGFDFAVARYLSNGMLDSSFHHDGMVSESIGNTGFCRAMVIQPDHKIVVGGYFLNPFSATNEFGLMRFKEDGTLDETFNGDGIVNTNMHIGAGVGNAMVLQPDGKIILAGQVFNEATFSWEIGMARYEINGNLDSTFDEDGISFLAMPGANFTITSAARQEDKKILVGGYFGTAPSNNLFAVARFHDDGTPDLDFGDNGIVLDSYGAEDNQITTLVIQPDGYILVAGTSLFGNADRFAIARLTPDGEKDATFGDEGVVIEVVGQNDGISTMALQQDGKLVVAGESFNGTRFDIAFARYETGLLSAVDDPLSNGFILSIYPNPAREFIHVQYELKKTTSIQYIMTDITGKKWNLTSSAVIKDPGMHEEMIPLPVDLITGMYWLSMQTHFGAKSTMLMIIK